MRQPRAFSKGVSRTISYSGQLRVVAMLFIDVVMIFVLENWKWVENVVGFRKLFRVLKKPACEKCVQWWCRAHPVQSRGAQLLSSERQCARVPVVLLHPRRWCAISTETRIISLWPSDCAIAFNLATVGRRAFPVFAANLWNSLPAHLTSSPLLTIFRQRLKIFLFRRPYPDLIIYLIVDLAVTLLFRPH